MAGIVGLFGGDNSQGGITPQMQALTQYTFGQNALANAQAFSGGPSHGTGLTQADAGAYFQQASQEQQFSQANTQAQNAFQQSQKNALQQQVAGLGTSLGSGGNFGTTSGRFG